VRWNETPGLIEKSERWRGEDQPEIPRRERISIGLREKKSGRRDHRIISSRHLLKREKKT